MRAVYFDGDGLKRGESICLEGDKGHHLINVVRVKIKDQIILLDGRGSKANCVVKTVTRKEVFVEVVDLEHHQKKESFDIALALLKRDSMVDSLRFCVELGVSAIYPIRTDYSQQDFIKEGRISRIFESACIQSNAIHLPAIEQVQTVSEELFNNYDYVVVFSTNKSFHRSIPQINSNEKVLIILGPEGGFSQDELSKWSSVGNCTITNLPTNILRASTAVPTSCGWLLGKIYRE